MPTFSPDSIVPRVLAVFSAVLATSLCFIAGLVAINALEHSRVSQVHRQAVTLVAGMASESVSGLRAAVKDLEPDCSERTLRTLRRWLLASEFVSEFGVLDDQGHLICTSTDGLLSSAIRLPDPDAVFVLRDKGETFSVYYDRPLELSGQGLQSTITALEKFDVVVNPFRLNQLYASGIDVLRIFVPGHSPNVAFRSSAIPDDVMIRLGKHRLADGDSAEWDLQTLSYLASSVVPKTGYLIQSASSLAQILKRYHRYFIALLLVSCLVGVLAFWAVLPLIIVCFSFDSRIRKLLHEDNVVCMLQPVYHLKSGKLSGCELLMRLQDGKNLVYPDKIIATVLHKKLTERFDRAVISRASIELDSLDFPPGFKVAVNFFPETFLSGLARHLLEEKFAKLTRKGIQFCAEVTEQQLSVAIVSEVRELKKNQYLVAVDDFGTGFSNLASVRALAPDFLKIDRSFVWDMEDRTIRSSLIPEIIQIARAVGAQVVAEGIENRSQVEHLTALGAEYGQGFFLGRPMPVHEFAALLHESTRRNHAWQ